MANLVSLQEAKRQLRITWADDDQHISFLVAACEASILNYVKKDYGWTTENVPPDVKLAILAQISSYYDFVRDGQSIETDSVALGYPPPLVTALLHRYRPISL